MFLIIENLLQNIHISGKMCIFGKNFVIFKFKIIPHNPQCHNYSWLSFRERSYIGFGFKAAGATATFFSEISILNYSEVYTPFSKKFLYLAVLNAKLFLTFMLTFCLLSRSNLREKKFSSVCWAGRTWFRTSILLSKLVR